MRREGLTVASYLDDLPPIPKITVRAKTWSHLVSLSSLSSRSQILHLLLRNSPSSVLTPSPSPSLDLLIYTLLCCPFPPTRTETRCLFFFLFYFHLSFSHPRFPARPRPPCSDVPVLSRAGYGSDKDRVEPNKDGQEARGSIKR